MSDGTVSFDKENPCPRCGSRRMFTDMSLNPICRRDKVTRICVTCASDQEYEAFYAQFGNGHSER